jgi:hypothetical protein
MPSNIDYLLEKHIKEENLPQFILICAIYHGFFPSNKLLKQFGSGYGPDNNILSDELMLKQKLSDEYKLYRLLNPKEGDEDDLKRELEKQYDHEYKEYLSWFEFYNRDMRKILVIDDRVRNLEVGNDEEKKFLRFITNYIGDQKDVIREKYSKILVPPVKETYDEARERLIKELTESIENLKLRLLFNDSFFEGITKKWLR